MDIHTKKVVLASSMYPKPIVLAPPTGISIYIVCANTMMRMKIRRAKKHPLMARISGLGEQGVPLQPFDATKTILMSVTGSPQKIHVSRENNHSQARPRRCPPTAVDPKYKLDCE
jgi:hypothetical protein